jgi:hypothetical protein
MSQLARTLDAQDERVGVLCISVVAVCDSFRDSVLSAASTRIVKPINQSPIVGRKDREAHQPKPTSWPPSPSLVAALRFRPAVAGAKATEESSGAGAQPDRLVPWRGGRNGGERKRLTATRSGGRTRRWSSSKSEVPFAFSPFPQSLRLSEPSSLSCDCCC